MTLVKMFLPDVGRGELAKVEEQHEKSWYKAIDIAGCDVRGDNLLNMQGCVQSTFVPVQL